MYCNKCGSRIDDDSLFCRECRQSIMEEVSPKAPTKATIRGKYRRKRKSRAKVIAAVLALAVACIGIVAFISFLVSDPEVDAAVETVQNGYLGEFTDITVKETINSTILHEQYAESTEPSVLETEPPTVTETPTLQAEIVYLLDLAYGTTGNVIGRLGSNIVYTGGESGSYTFYHASDPDVYYGYVPHDWEHPEIHGDELISAIWAAGDAWISPNLTADMTKADLDSVAWNTPDVQNVYVETYYNQLLEETICSYRIETNNAYITYEWYLDSGNGVEFPASSVAISPRRANTTVQPETSNNISMEGYVIESSGGLKIRSGPSTSYEEIGRLAPLEKVVVLEIQSNGNRDWGRIDRGWVCMDYIILGTSDNMQPSTSGYSAVYAQYRNAEACNYQEYGNYISESIQRMSQLGADFDIYYAEIDLNRDGIQELVIGGRDVSYDDSSIEKFDLFTLSNNIPTRIVEGSSFGNRAHLYIYSDGTFAVSGSGGASTNSTEFYTLPAYSAFASVTHGYGTMMGEPYYHGVDGGSFPISENDLYSLPQASQLLEMNISWTKLS